MAQVKDPVCGMMIESQTAAGHVEHNGKSWYFCSEGCRQQFEQDPQKFAGNGSRA